MTPAARRYLRLAWSAARALEGREVVHWLALFRMERRGALQPEAEA